MQHYLPRWHSISWEQICKYIPRKLCVFTFVGQHFDIYIAFSGLTCIHFERYRCVGPAILWIDSRSTNPNIINGSWTIYSDLCEFIIKV